MNVFELTRALVDIESITENEERVGNALFAQLADLAARHGGHVERIPVEANRFRGAKKLAGALEANRLRAG